MATHRNWIIPYFYDSTCGRDVYFLHLYSMGSNPLARRVYFAMVAGGNVPGGLLTYFKEFVYCFLCYHVLLIGTGRTDHLLDAIKSAPG